jgi:nickel-dependent lactate racemase
MDLAHRAGREFLAGRCQVDAIPADIVISTNGGYPLDQNIYQAVKGMTAAEATVRKGGIIVMLAYSNDGHDSEEFYKTFAREKDLERRSHQKSGENSGQSPSNGHRHSRRRRGYGEGVTFPVNIQVLHTTFS